MRLPNQAKPVIRTNGFIGNIGSDNVKLQAEGDCFRTFNCTGDVIGRRFTLARCEHLNGNSYFINGNCQLIGMPAIVS